MVDHTLIDCRESFHDWVRKGGDPDWHELIEKDYAGNYTNSVVKGGWIVWLKLWPQLQQQREISVKDGFDQKQAHLDLEPEARELLRHPIVQSCLYDINLLPQQIATKKHWFYMLSVISHIREAMEPKREIIAPPVNNEFVADGCEKCACNRDYPECSGDSKSCPENEGYGCCKGNGQ